MNDQFSPAPGTLANDVLDNALSSDSNEQLFILNFGTRLLTAFTDKEILINIALETLADFSRGRRVAIMSLDDKQERLDVDGTYSPAGPARPKTSYPVEGSVLKKRMDQKVMSVAPLCVENGVPLPVEEGPAGANRCLCLPLVGASFHVIGLATVEIPATHRFSFFEQQQLKILSTVLAISLDNAKLFARIIHDSLTNLYTRRFYEIRVEEELNRLKRTGGFLGVVLLDLDHFKRINDSCGHLMGDDVLRQFAMLVKDHTRKGSTLASRYGGEEFVLLMPDACLDEAVFLAERIRTLCSGHTFTGNSRNLHVTVSGGVAFTDATESLAPQELFQRADTALYKAKNDGRNRIAVWESPGQHKI